MSHSETKAAEVTPSERSIGNEQFPDSMNGNVALSSVVFLKQNNPFQEVSIPNEERKYIPTVHEGDETQQDRPEPRGLAFYEEVDLDW